MQIKVMKLRQSRGEEAAWGLQLALAESFSERGPDLTARSPPAGGSGLT